MAMVAALPVHQFLVIGNDLKKSRVLYMPAVVFTALTRRGPTFAIGFVLFGFRRVFGWNGREANKFRFRLRSTWMGLRGPAFDGKNDRFGGLQRDAFAETWRLLVGEAKPKSTYGCRDRYDAFQLGELVADAHLRAAAEGEVSKLVGVVIQPAVGKESIRIGKVEWVAMRDVGAQNDAGAGGNRVAT